MTWRDFEERVRYIYSTLLNLRDESVVVSRSTTLVGRSGAEHQIDVYWEFSRANVRHRVAIECKDHDRPIDKGYIQEFKAKLDDIGNIIGLVVAKRGFQEGAQIFAKHYGIETITVDNLPGIVELFGARLAAVALPDEFCHGEPFWTIMEIRNGRVTGSYYAISNGANFSSIPLFFSKAHAQRFFLLSELSPSRWGIRGLQRASVRAFAEMLKLFESRGSGASILFLPPGFKDDAPFVSLRLTQSDLLKEYVQGQPATE